MSKMYYWCNLQNGAKRTVGYIDERGAKVGNEVEMIDLDGEFWTVTSVGASASKDEVNNNRQKSKTFGALEHTDRIVRRVGA